MVPGGGRCMKDIARSIEPWQWFGHDPERWPEFRHHYAGELQQNAAAIDGLRELARHDRVTPVFGARDEGYDATARDRQREVCLARAGPANQHHIALPSDDVATGEIAHQGYVDWRVLERKAIDVLGERQ